MASISGTGQAAYTRHPAETLTTAHVLATAVTNAIADAGMDPVEVDGLGVASFTLEPDHAIDLAWRLGLRLRWLMQDTNGGASGGNLLQHAARAVDAGEARCVVLVAGDVLTKESFRSLVDNYNSATRRYLTPLEVGGPNALFAMLTLRQMRAHGLSREDYGRVVLSQRSWAELNPNAVYRQPLTAADYAAAPMVTSPLCRLDCVPPVTGADAVVVVPSGRGAEVLAGGTAFNQDNQVGDGLTTGVAALADQVWGRAGVEPADVGVVDVYDDYPAMVVAQLQDLGLMGNQEPAAYLETHVASRRVAVNSSGGQLSAGQAGAAGGMLGLVEASRQMLGRAGRRQVDSPFAVVTGYGMVAYRFGACATMHVLGAAR